MRIPPLPHDRALPQLRHLFEPEALRQGAAEALGAEVLATTPLYLRYKPGTSALVLLDLILLTASGSTVELPVTLHLAPAGRGERRVVHPKLRESMVEVAARQDAPPCEPVGWSASLDGLFQVYPLDHDLRFLLRATDPTEMTRQLRKRAEGYEACEVTGTPALVRYKPARRAVLRYALANAPEDELYGKVHRQLDLDLLRAQTDALLATDVPTPDLVMAHPRRPFVAHAAMPGHPLATLRGTSAFNTAMGPTIDLIRAVQQSAAPGEVVTPIEEGQAGLATLELLSVVVPHLAPRLAAIGDQLMARLAAVAPEAVPVHGDFYDDQVLVNLHGLGLLDLDEMHRSHPLLDVGNLLAHLHLAEADGEDVREPMELLRVQAHAAWPTAAAHLDTFVALGLVKLAIRPLRQLRPHWPNWIEQNLTRIEELMQGDMSRVASQALTESRATGSARPDPHLPQLRVLLDPASMSQRLTQVTAGPAVTVETATLVRHKPGRRAILRYEVQSPDGASSTLFTKTFASARGPRVYGITQQIVEARAFGAGVALPAPVAWLDDLKCMVQRSVPGQPVVERLLTGDTATMPPLAEALHRFHSSHLDLGRTHDLKQELAPLSARVEQVRTVDADLGALAGTCLQAAGEQAAASWNWRFQPVHRDFYHDQVLIHGDRLAVLDLDDATMSEPAVDIANFVAHLMLLGVQHDRGSAGLRPAIDAFLKRAHELDAGLDRELVTFLTGTTLFRLAGVHVYRLQGQRVARELLAAAAARLMVVSAWLS